jgi:GxxExxY protein
MAAQGIQTPSGAQLPRIAREDSREKAQKAQKGRRLYRTGTGFPCVASVNSPGSRCSKEGISHTKAMKDMMQLCDTVRETAFAIHCYHKHGHMEKVYENALAHRLRKLGLDVKQQHPLTVFDEDGTVIGDYYADLLVENCLIVELKAVKALADEHIAQLLGYLRASRIEHGLLMNFGAQRYEIRKYALSQPSDSRGSGRWASLLFSLCCAVAVRVLSRQT